MNIEEKFQKFFLSDIAFVVNHKVIKKGKLLNANIKDFFIIFKLEVQKGGITSFEVPYPFELADEKNRIKFDYRLEKFVFKLVLNFTIPGLIGNDGDKTLLATSIFDFTSATKKVNRKTNI